uniref:Pentapeptide repeat-containing protein n=1 Tax=Candidatus Kentrum sp. LFY TaxID=2126342 RepID=A0A450UTI8_9GAMM|nr:MAG: Pentapeptide repeat-containing protein [Candidatus Kentron sp. LFY]
MHGKNKTYNHEYSFMVILTIFFIIAPIFFIIEYHENVQDSLEAIGILFGVISLILGIFKYSSGRQESNFHAALINIGAEDSTVRSLSIGMLKVYMEKEKVDVFHSTFYRILDDVLMTKRPHIVADGLVNHLAKEKDKFVGEVCIDALLKADKGLHPRILNGLCDNNRSLWKRRNRESSRVYRTEFDITFRTLINEKNLDHINAKKHNARSEIEGELIDAVHREAHRIAQLKAEQYADSFGVPLSLIRRAIVGFIRNNGQDLINKGINFHDIHLDYTNLIGMDLSNYDLTGATLTHVNFKKAKLVGTKLDHAVILNSYFSETDIKEASFDKAIIGSCHFHDLLDGEDKPSSKTMNDAQLVASNKYTPENCKFDKEEDLPKDNRSIYLTKEFDWKTIWVPIGTKEGNALFHAKQYSQFSDGKIEMDFLYTELKTPYGETIIERCNSTDKHNGRYIIEDEFDIRSAHMKYITGYRILTGDQHRWEGVYWNIPNSNVRCEF